MSPNFRAFAAVLLFAIGGLASASAFAQTPPTMTFVPKTTTGAGSVVPELTWSTTPAATSCTASGAADWTGTKAASGTVTLAAITAARTYQLVCTWPGDTTARITWTAPTQNTDGSPLTNLAGYRLFHGPSATQIDSAPVNVAANVLEYTWTALPAGPRFFSVAARNTADVLSDPVIVNKTLTASTNVTRTVAIVVNPKPAQPGNVTVE